MFSTKTYISRRKRLAEKVKSGLILLLGNEESPMNYPDNTFPFRQDSSFLYYFGIDIPGLSAIIDIDNQKEVVFGNDFTIDDVVWMGSQPTIAARAEKSGITDTQPTSALYNMVSDAISAKRAVHFLPPYRADNKVKLAQLLKCSTTALSDMISVDLIKAVVSQREIKTAEEIVQIEAAVNTSVAMHVAAIGMIQPGMTEAQVAAKVHQTALATGGDISFPIIATINGQTLHNHYHGNTVKKGDLFLLDAGAQNTMHYSGDLSSTFPVDNCFTTQQKVIYEASLKAHEAAISAIAPGVPFKAVHLSACRSIAESMRALGLMKGNIDDAVAAGAHALFFPCGTGHQMGLDVHDMEDLDEVWVGYDGVKKSTQFGLKSLRFAKPLKQGHVFTIEPGIYFIPDLIDLWQSQNKFSDFINWDQVNKFRHFGGIRNEEDFVMTKDSFRRLGKPKPKTVEEIEALRR